MKQFVHICIFILAFASLYSCGKSDKKIVPSKSDGIAVCQTPDSTDRSIVQSGNAQQPSNDSDMLAKSQEHSSIQTDWDVAGLIGNVASTSTTWSNGDYEECYFDTDGSLLRRVTGNESKGACNSFIYEAHKLKTINLQVRDHQQFFTCQYVQKSKSDIVIEKTDLHKKTTVYMELWYDAKGRLLRSKQDNTTTDYVYMGSGVRVQPPMQSEILSSDRLGNWTKIKLSNGHSAHRRVEYF
jgi:hypothetical protein